jgi:DNA-binding beta-propeller fold protein YncE
VSALTLLGLLLVAQAPDTSLRFPAFTPSRAIPVDGGRKLYVVGRTAPSSSWFTYILGCPEFDLRSVTSLVDLYLFPPGAATNWRRNKVYQTGSYDLTVFDNTGDSCIGQLPNLRSRMTTYSSPNDRLYAAGRGVGYIIDCATDSVVKVLNPLDSLAGVCVWDSVGNKVYMGGWGFRNGGRLNVIDCATDSVVLTFPTSVSWPRHAVYYPQRRRIYLQGEEQIGECAAVDCVGDSLIRRYGTFGSLEAPVVVPQEDKVYWLDQTGFGYGDTLQVTDCRAETVLHYVEPPRPPWNSWFLHGSAYAEWSNRLYVTAGGRVGSTEGYWLVAVDCSGDTVLGWIPLPSEPVSVVANPYDRRIYVVSYADSAIYVYRDEVPAVSDPGLPMSLQLAVVVDVTPNPFARNARVQFNAPVAGPAKLRVYTAAGQLVYTESRMVERSGPVEFELDGARLGSGAYIVQVSTPAGMATAKTTVLK